MEPDGPTLPWPEPVGSIGEQGGPRRESDDAIHDHLACRSPCSPGDFFEVLGRHDVALDLRTFADSRGSRRENKMKIK